MLLGTEVGLSPGHIVLHGDPVRFPPKKGHTPLPPIFGPCLLWQNGWIDQDATWSRGRPASRRLCVKWSSPIRGTAPPPFFSGRLLWPNGRQSELLLSTCFMCFCQSSHFMLCDVLCVHFSAYSTYLATVYVTICRAVLGMLTVGNMMSMVTKGKVDVTDTVSKVVYRQFKQV